MHEYAGRHRTAASNGGRGAIQTKNHRPLRGRSGSGSEARSGEIRIKDVGGAIGTLNPTASECMGRGCRGMTGPAYVAWYLGRFSDKSIAENQQRIAELDRFGRHQCMNQQATG